MDDDSEGADPNELRAEAARKMWKAFPRKGAIELTAEGLAIWAADSGLAVELRDQVLRFSRHFVKTNGFAFCVFGPEECVLVHYEEGTK